MRFLDDQNSVLTTEFLDFILTPGTIRDAKLATSAVRMSVDMLQISGVDGVDINKFASSDLFGEHGDDDLSILQRGLKKISKNWGSINESLEREFDRYFKSVPSSKGKLMPIKVFKVFILTQNYQFTYL